MEIFIAAARGDSLRWWALIAFIADTGRRIGETLSLKWEYFHLHDEPAYVELPVNKSGRPQYVPLTRRLANDVFTEANIVKLANEKRNGRRQFEREPSVYPFPWKYDSAMKVRVLLRSRWTSLPGVSRPQPLRHHGTTCCGSPTPRRLEA